MGVQQFFSARGVKGQSVDAVLKEDHNFGMRAWPTCHSLCKFILLTMKLKDDEPEGCGLVAASDGDQLSGTENRERGNCGYYEGGLL
uniref:Uncharacterized protein n=1 Tax=Physcomitrium patens TaxID=3218 RepID=A0A2K1LA86_PHYPA|nr:hypothetical protein PHYPA_001367 [Physcomitrium patens]